MPAARPFPRAPRRLASTPAMSDQPAPAITPPDPTPAATPAAAAAGTDGLLELALTELRQRRAELLGEIGELETRR